MTLKLDRRAALRVAVLGAAAAALPIHALAQTRVPRGDGALAGFDNTLRAPLGS